MFTSERALAYLTQLAPWAKDYTWRRRAGGLNGRENEGDSLILVGPVGVYFYSHVITRDRREDRIYIEVIDSLLWDHLQAELTTGGHIMGPVSARSVRSIIPTLDAAKWCLNKLEVEYQTSFDELCLRDDVVMTRLKAIQSVWVKGLIFGQPEPVEVPPPNPAWTVPLQYVDVGVNIVEPVRNAEQTIAVDLEGPNEERELGRMYPPAVEYTPQEVRTPATPIPPNPTLDYGGGNWTDLWRNRYQPLTQEEVRNITYTIQTDQDRTGYFDVTMTTDLNAVATTADGTTRAQTPTLELTDEQMRNATREFLARLDRQRAEQNERQRNARHWTNRRRGGRQYF